MFSSILTKDPNSCTSWQADARHMLSYYAIRTSEWLLPTHGIISHVLKRESVSPRHMPSSRLCNGYAMGTKRNCQTSDMSGPLIITCLRKSDRVARHLAFELSRNLPVGKEGFIYSNSKRSAIQSRTPLPILDLMLTGDVA